MLKNTKIVIVFVGLPGSGKDTCLRYLAKKYQAQIFSFTTMLDDTLRRFHLENSRDNLIKMSECLRHTFGNNIMAKTMAKEVETSTANIIAIGNARRLADIEFLKELPGFVLVEISADIKTRYERIISRNEKAGENNISLSDFVAIHGRTTELSILEVAEFATEHINNDNSEQKLCNDLDALIEKFSE